MGLTRRTVLAIPSLAIANRAFANSLRVERTEDGGFRVLGDTQTWGKTAVQLQSALGDNARAEVFQDSLEIKLTGTLAGEAVQLDFKFGQSAAGLMVTTQCRIGAKLIANGHPRRFPALLAEPIPASPLLKGFGIAPAGSTFCRLDKELAFHLGSQGGFSLGHGLTLDGLLQLLPGRPDNPVLAAFEEPQFKSSRNLGKRGKAAIVIAPKPKHLSVVQADGGSPHLRLKGGGQLTVANTRLHYGENSVIRLSATGPSAGAWWLDLRLPEHEQRIDTPEGRVELSATGSSDIVGEGRAGKVLHLSAKAQLRHIGLRLPVHANATGFADLGRLDFRSGTIVSLAIAAAHGANEQTGRIPLAKQAGPLRVSLDSADLWTRRDADMFHARFGFRGLDLVVRKRAAVLQHPAGLPGQPTLIVRLPPQHVMEEAFPRLAPTLPGRQLRPEELSAAFDPPAREKLAKEMTKEFGESFTKFSGEFSTRYAGSFPDKDKRGAGYPSERTQKLESIYIGQDGLITPLGRRAAREAAQKLAELPQLGGISLGLDEILIADVLRRNGRLEARPVDAASAQAASRALLELLDEAAKRQADLANILRVWRGTKAQAPLLLQTWRDNWPVAVREGKIRAALASTLKEVPITAEPLPSLEKALQDGYRSRSPQALPIAARAAEETRLAFEIKIAAGGTYPWSLASLLDWGAMELRVSSRAETSLAAAETAPAEELSRLLAYQLGLKSSTTVEERLRRLREILRKGPADDQTAIELPARLILSPDSGGIAPGKPGLARSARFQASNAHVERRGRVPLWRADLRETPGHAFSLRAIHTPDFEPPRPCKDCDPPHDWLDEPLKHPERGLQVARPQPPVFALDDFDRRQIVALSSLHGLPVLARRGAGGVLQTSQISPPEDFRLTEGLQPQDLDEQGLYVPRTLPTRLLRITPIGGTLDLEAPFVPPAALRDLKGNNIFDAYSLERIRILVSLGREVTTEVVYKGFLYPLGFRAALLKVTERHYLPWPDPYNTAATALRGPVAFQVQRLFIQVANPEKTFPGVAHPFEGRGWPARALTMLTQQTPDLLDPTRTARAGDSENWREELSGRLDQDERSGLVFWPRTAPGEKGNVRFRFAVDGRPEPVSMPLIFVDNQAAHDARTMRQLQRYWNHPGARSFVPRASDQEADMAAWSALRRIDHSGALRRYAEEDVSGDTTFETLSWDVRVDSREAVQPPRFILSSRGEGDPAREPSIAWQMNAAMESDDQPPFYPRCLEATIRHDGVARFTGNPQKAIHVQFLTNYLETGLPILFKSEIEGKSIEEFEQLRTERLAKQREIADAILRGETPTSDPRREAILRVLGEEPPNQTMGQNGERAAGLVRPEIAYPFIGRKGPIGGKTPANPEDVPATVDRNFVTPDARILGLVSLSSLLEAAKGAAAAPLLRQTIEFGLGDAKGSADVVAKDFARAIRGFLTPVLHRFSESEGETAALLRSAYRSVWSTLSALNASLERMETTGTSALPEVVTAGRTVRSELDRLAANPLGPLTELGQSELSTIRDNIEQASRVALQNGLADLLSQEIPQRIRDAFLPVGEAFFALNAALGGLQPPPSSKEEKLLVDHVGRAFDEATSEILALRPKELPESLIALRRRWFELAQAKLKADPVPDVSHERLQALRSGIQRASSAFDQLPHSPLLARFYSALRLLVNADWRGALAALEQEGVHRLRRWANSRLDDACTASGTKMAVAAKRLRDALLANAVGRPCEPAVCGGGTPPAPAAEICARLWALCTKVDLSEPAKSTGAALGQLAAALANFGTGNPCEPTAVEGANRLIKELRRLDAARAAFGSALGSLLQAITKSAQNAMEAAAAREAALLAAALLRLLRPPEANFSQLASALEPALGTAGAAAIVEPMRTSDSFIGAACDDLEKVTDTPALLAALAKLDGTKPLIRLDALMAAGRAAVDDLVFAAALPAAAAADAAAKKILSAMSAFLSKAQEFRTKGLLNLRPIDQRLDLRGEERLSVLLFLNLTPQLPSAPADPIVGKDDLDREREHIDQALNSNASARADELVERIAAWFLPQGAGSSVQRILNQVGDRLLAAARHKLLRTLNIDALREKLENELARLIPTRKILDYAWAAPPLKDEITLGDIVSFRGGGYEVRAETALDLRDLTAPVSARINGSVGDFDISIQLKAKKLLTLFFSGVGFEGTPGSPARIDEPKLKRFEPTGFLLFLAGLAAYCKLQEGDAGGGAASAADTPVPNGIYSIPRPNGKPGLRAGYGLGFGAIQLGTMAVLDVTFDAHVELPFNGDAGHAQLSLSTPEKPAMLVCAPYGGTAYARLRSIAKAGKADLATEFDIAFQFGGAVAISYGSLQGSGRVMTGLRVFDGGGSPGFSALFVAAFEGHIACFGIAASFVLAMDYVKEKLKGTAALTYSFSVGPVTKSFTVHASRDAGSGLENNASLMRPQLGDPLIMLAGGSTPHASLVPAGAAVLHSDVPGMMQDWTAYSARYANPSNVLGRRLRA
ncbi:hypothetical protein FQV39_04575 [Bosea sp. F3-2]|uniref:hypothetical protein n=1 Tax=Bosea sp. F3-2 TaxID=2599640 RepID=UPI0011ED7B0B|nr:hypothetical protein [Bosea sp. F3-2]QEL21932.1 hypothetical protein FQV39_04575 [Bosea sp. F3-2]